MRTSCPCGCYWDHEPSSGTRCVKCGRTFKIWKGGAREWVPDPTVVLAQKLYDEGQDHFRMLHLELRKIRWMLKDLRNHTPAWRKAQIKKAARRKERESK